MAKSVKKNYIFNLIYQLIVLLIPVISIPYVSRVLLEDGVGRFSYSESIVSYFVLFAVIGSTTYAHREIGKVQDDAVSRSRLFREIFLIRLIMSLIALAGYSVYLALVKTDFTVNLIFALNIVNVVFDITWFFQGVEDFGKTVIFGLVPKLLDFAFIFIFVKSPDDLWLYTLGKCGFMLLGNMGMWALLPKYIVKCGSVRPFRHFKIILVFFVPVIATQIYTVLDKSMIGWFSSSAAENGYYDYAEKIVRMALTVITALGAVLVPRISRAYSENNSEDIDNLIKRASSFVWMLSVPMIFGIIAVADVFVPVYLGEHFNKSALLMQIFSPLVLFVGMAQIFGVSFLIPIGKQNVNLIAVVIAALVNLSLNLILIPKFFSVGATIASVAAEFIGVAIQLGYVFYKKLFGIGKFFGGAVKYIISGALMFAVLILLKKALPVNVTSLILLIFAGVASYFIVLLILRDKFLTESLGKAFGKFVKKKK